MLMVEVFACLCSVGIVYTVALHRLGLAMQG